MDQRKAHIIEEKDRTDDIKIEENVNFSQMYLSDSVLSGLNAAGFVWPSPIQLSAIPLGRCGLDLVVQAKSGTGKTLVFAVVALEMISVAAKTTQVLVVVPTREIAVQITQVIDAIGSSISGLKAHSFIGGLSVVSDKSKLSCCHIAIGTPGRLNHLIEMGFLKVDNVRLMVLDEADELLKGQFKFAISKLASHLPLNKQVLALSATYPEEISSVLDKIMRSPSYIRLDKENPSLIGVNQFVRAIPLHPQPHHRYKAKQDELMSILSSIAFNQCLIFSNSQMRAESLCTYLRDSNWPVSYLSGGQAQTERLQAFEALCSYKIRVLVSTDVSARGIDSEHVDLVINLDIPWDHATYLHRVGRAGRFGSYGTSISLACEGEELESLKAISTLANIKLKVITEGWTPGMCLSAESHYDFLEQLNEKDLKSWVEYRAYHNSIRKGKSQSKLVEDVNYSKLSKLESKDRDLSLEEHLKQKLLLESNKNLAEEKLEAQNKRVFELLNRSPAYSAIPFSCCDLLKQCREEVPCPSAAESVLALQSISSKDPSTLELEDLQNFIGDLDKSGKSLKIEQKLDSISLLEEVIQGKDFVNGEIEAKNDDLQKLCNPGLSSPPLNGVDEKISENLSLSSQTAANGPAKSKKSSENNYCNNTGYGDWVPVIKKKAHQRTIANSHQRHPQYSCEESLPLLPLKEDSRESNGRTNQTCAHYDPYYESYYASAWNYIHSAQKFGSMMEYVRTLGQMSARAAQDYQDKLDRSVGGKRRNHKRKPHC